MTDNLPPQPPLHVERGRSRWIIIGYGIALFIWLRLEDNAVWTAAVLGVGLAWLIFRPPPPSPAPLRREGASLARVPPLHVERAAGGEVRFILRGALIGGGGAVVAAVLMLLKTGSHAHVFPDYPLGVILAMLERAPVWALAGALIGLGWTFVARPKPTLAERTN